MFVDPVHAMKNYMGFDFRGITTDMALRLPFFRHYLGWIGTIPASSHILMKHVSIMPCESHLSTFT